MNANGLKVSAEELALRQRSISISEFFAKNRHLLGFDNPTRALLTAVKEAVDNSLDACEEAGVLPEIIVKINEITEERFRVSVEDNGPGIIKQQIPNIFGKLLYGSKFHILKMARGQQGIGISAAALYGQITTGKPITIISKTSPDKPAYYYEIIIDTNKNEPVISKEDTVEWQVEHGTRVEIEIGARYVKGNRSVDDYLKQTALVNPHAKIIYTPPGTNGEIIYERSVEKLPPEPRAIKPHPYGVELGNLIKLLQSSKSRQLSAALQNEFSRVSPRVAKEICMRAGISENASSKRIAQQEIEKLYKAINETKIMNPPTDCLSPIGEQNIIAGIKANIKGEFYTAITRLPAVYRGNPFQVEVGLVYGIPDYPQDEYIILNRYANRVPLLYQAGACVISKAVSSTNWKNYGLQQAKDSLPIAPMFLMVHIASVWVPFTSEAKEAIAHYPEILRECELALQEVGRRLAIFLKKRQRAEYDIKRRSIFERYSDEVSISLASLTGQNREKIKKDLLAIVKTLTKDGELEA